MTESGYGQFCPVAMAAEVLCTRWTLVMLSEMLSGSTRFNEIRRGVPRMSPALLSKRLKELEEWGLIERTEKKDAEGGEYLLTPAALELEPIITALGNWSQRWVDSELTLQNLDAQLLMWNVRRKLSPDPMPKRKTVVQIIFPELAQNKRNYWLIVSPGQDVDLCSIDPGFDVNLFVSADLKAMTSAFIGPSTLDAEIAADRILLTGDNEVSGQFKKWFVQSRYAAAARCRAAE
ncbi:MAG: helix-turn-helix domain-containing protein [Parvularculaceae bacterium]|nr:helix-turn-helix domain-containing protein [Parvularculaceae bacterium]